MTKKNSHWKKILAFLCIFLILLYAVVTLIPHAHCCKDASCSLCQIIDISNEILINAAATSAFLGCLLLLLAKNAHAYILSGREKTPVGQKVKLSD